jgi:hypothetical protein
MQLSVALVLPGGSVGAPSGFAVPYRQAWADWGYLRAGDYLVGPEGTFFVAAIEPPKPMLVVLANACVTLRRAAAPVLAGLNQYGAVLPATETTLIEGFPASLLLGGVDDRTKTGLPGDTKVPGFIALLPTVAGVQPRVSDLLTNERNETFVVNAVEQYLGTWRLSLLQTVT